MSYFHLERTTPEEVGISSQSILNMIEAIETCGYTEPHGLMIMRHGKICAEGWWHPYSPGRAHTCWSVSKTYTATAIGLAIKDGYLSLDTRLVDIFPELVPENPCENLYKIQIRHLLTMSCGMKTMCADGPDWLRRFIQTPVEYEPGTVFMYNSMGTNTLGAIINRVTKQDMEIYLKEQLADKLGMNTDQLYWTRIPDNYCWAAGGLFASTENNLRLMQLYLQGGQWNGVRILDAEYVKLATTMQIDNTIGYTPEGNRQDSPEAICGYGFQIWMCSYPGAYRADGAQGQFSIVFPDLDMVVAINETCPDTHTRYLLKLIYEQLAKNVSGQKVLPADPAAYAALCNKLQHLTLSCTAYAPVSPVIQQIQNRVFVNQSGSYTFLTAFEPRELRGSGICISSGIDRISFCFTTRDCCVKYTENGLLWKLHISLDGCGTENRIQFPQHMLTNVILSGSWQTDRIFTVRARWIESSVEKTIMFRFEEESLYIEGRLTTGMLGAYQIPDDIAFAVAED